MEGPLTIILAPLAFLLIWSVFMCSKSLVVSLVSLLVLSLTLPTIFMDSLKLFWPCGLLLILMSTGLIVVFAYIVSLYSNDFKTWGGLWMTFCLWMAMVLFYCLVTPASKKILHFTQNVSVTPSLSLLLISLLLFLVVSFIRIVYSKGGGFRKKF